MPLHQEKVMADSADSSTASNPTANTDNKAMEAEAMAVLSRYTLTAVGGQVEGMLVLPWEVVC